MNIYDVIEEEKGGVSVDVKDVGTAAEKIFAEYYEALGSINNVRFIAVKLKGGAAVEADDEKLSHLTKIYNNAVAASRSAARVAAAAQVAMEQLSPEG